MQRILITGATGFVGRHLVHRLSREPDLQLRLVSRDKNRLETLFPRSGAGSEREVEYVGADAHDPRALPHVLEGVDAVFYLIHSLGQSDFADRDAQLATQFAQAARDAGVRRIVYLGGLGSPDQLSPHLESRQKTGALLGSTGIPVTEFRAAVVVGPGSAVMTMIERLVQRSLLLVQEQYGTARCQPIALGDVVEYLAASLRQPESLGRVFEIGGDDVVSYNEMVSTFARISGRRRLSLRLPIAIPRRAAALSVSAVTGLSYELVLALISGAGGDVLVRDDAARRLFDIVPRSFERAMREALAP